MSDERTRLRPTCCTLPSDCPKTAQCTRHTSTAPDPKYIGALTVFAYDWAACKCSRFQPTHPTLEDAAA